MKQKARFRISWRLFWISTSETLLLTKSHILSCVFFSMYFLTKNNNNKICQHFNFDNLAFLHCQSGHSILDTRLISSAASNDKCQFRYFPFLFYDLFALPSVWEFHLIHWLKIFYNRVIYCRFYGRFSWNMICSRCFSFPSIPSRDIHKTAHFVPKTELDYFKTITYTQIICQQEQLPKHTILLLVIKGKKKLLQHTFSMPNLHIWATFEDTRCSKRAILLGIWNFYARTTEPGDTTSKET
jgi:hypothetical protein